MTPLLPSAAAVQQRLTEQLRRVTEGVRAGTISKQEATAFSSSLMEVSTALRKDSFVDRSTLASAARTIDGVRAAIGVVANDGAVDARQGLDHLEALIDDHQKTGKLGPIEAMELRAQLHSLRYLSDAGRLDVNQFKAFKTSVMGKVNDEHIEVSTRMDWLRRLISTGVRDGSLSQVEAQSLSAELEQLKPRTGPVPPSESTGVAGLAGKLDALAKKIWERRLDGSVDVPTRRRAVEAALGRNFGQLTGVQREELNRLMVDVSWASQHKNAAADQGALLNQVTARLAQFLALNAQR